MCWCNTVFLHFTSMLICLCMPVNFLHFCVTLPQFFFLFYVVRLIVPKCVSIKCILCLSACLCSTNSPVVRWQLSTRRSNQSEGHRLGHRATKEQLQRCKQLCYLKMTCNTLILMSENSSDQILSPSQCPIMQDFCRTDLRHKF